MARSSTLRKRALKRMASQPPPAVEVRRSGIELREVYDDMPSTPLVFDEASSTSLEATSSTSLAATSSTSLAATSSTSLEATLEEASSGSLAPTVQPFDHHDESFFGADTHPDEDHHLDDIPEDRHSQAHVVARRTRASSMVKTVLLGCAALVGIGFAAQRIRTSYEQKHEESLRASAAMSLNASNVEAPIPAAVAAPAVVPAAAAAPAVVAPTVATTLEATPVAAPVAIAPAPTTEPVAAAAPEAPSEKPVIDVKAEKRKAEQALDLGKYAAALEHAEKAVEGDSEDAGAWLLLGAVKQAKGDMKGAAIAFGKCVKDAKRGPKHECAAMMR